jgi:hypothetical protein
MKPIDNEMVAGNGQRAEKMMKIWYITLLLI